MNPHAPPLATPLMGGVGGGGGIVMSEIESSAHKSVIKSLRLGCYA